MVVEHLVEIFTRMTPTEDTATGIAREWWARQQQYEATEGEHLSNKQGTTRRWRVRHAAGQPREGETAGPDRGEIEGI